MKRFKLLQKWPAVAVLLLATLLPQWAEAYDFMVDGLCYDINSDGTSVTVTYQNTTTPRYSNLTGAISVPASVTNSGTTYSVTSIGPYAFMKCSNLRSVTIPNSVKIIRGSAFNGCNGLTSVIIGNSVTSIGGNAFNECSSLTSVTIGNSVTTIGEKVFQKCSALTSVTIPNSVTTIGLSAFYGCSGLTKVYINDLAAWCGISFSNSYSNPLRMAGHLYLNNIEVRDLVIPDSVTNVPFVAFWGCSGLTSVTIPNSVTSIGQSAFNGCSGLTSVTIGNSVTSIGKFAFYDCSGLTSVTIGNSVTSIGDTTFYNCRGLTSVTIPNSVTSIGSSTFQGCSGLTSVTIGNSVTSIGDYAFSGCTGLSSVTWNPKSFSDFTSSNNPFSSAKTSIKNFIFGDEVQIIPAYLCYQMSAMTSVTIGNSVTSIGDYAFSGCTGLSSVTWNPKSFSDFTSSYNPFFSAKTSIKNFIFGDEVQIIPAYLCYQMSAMTSVTIGNSVTDIGSNAFNGCSGLTSVTWNAKSCSDFAYDNYPFSSAKTSIKNFIFGDEVEIIPASLCYNMSALTSVTIPNSVTSIGNYAFYGCSGLTSVTIPNSVTSIGSNAFFYCIGLTSVTIGNSVTSIGNYAFWGCSGLTSVTIPNSVTSIGGSAFSGCSGLTSVTIPNSVTSIGESAFRYCRGLTVLIIGNNVASISRYAFDGCSNLMHLYSLIQDPSNVSLGYNVFGDVPVETCMLHVPEGTMTSYQLAPQWKDFSVIDYTQISRYDVNRDSFTDVGDINAVINKILGRPGAPLLEIADVNGDDEVDIFDVNEVIGAILGHGK